MEEYSLTEVNESETTPSEELKNADVRARRSFRLSPRTSERKSVKVRAPRKPLRTIGMTVALAGMVATVAVPAIGALMPSAEAASTNSALTLQQVAENGSQSFVAASSVSDTAVTRDGYSATTPDEIAQKKAEEAAIERAKAAAAAAAASVSASSSKPVNFNPSSQTGIVVFPLEHVNTFGDGFMSRGGAHQGVDLLTDAMTPIYAAHSGTVVVSSESYWGYGVAVEVEGDVDGVNVNTRYGHMTYGTRTVNVGDYVKQGTIIGYVGSTGSSTANHLHFEVRINGSLTDPISWLQAYGAM